MFDGWLNSCEASDFSKLRDLLLLEQFRLVSRDLEIYLNEREIVSSRCASELADGYEAAHGRKSVGSFSRKGPSEGSAEDECQNSRSAEEGAWCPPSQRND